MSIESVTQPIKTETLENHERMVEERMLSLQFEYAGRLAKKTIPNIEGNEETRAFVSIIDQCSYIKECINEIINKEANLSDDETYEELKKTIYLKMNKIFYENGDDWIEKTQKMIREECTVAVEKLKIKYPQEVVKNHTDHYQKAGMVSFRNIMEEDDAKAIKFLGLDPGDDYISIHISDMFKQKAKGEADMTLTPSLQKLAVEIIEKYPQTKAVLARSWLVDTPYGPRMGLQKIKREKDIENKSSFWGQFLDQNGQFNKDRITQFMTTGKPPFYIAHGYWPVLDFLKKYLPEDKKGKVTLKEILPEYKEEYEHDTKLLAEIKNNWENLKPEDIEKKINECVLLKKFENSDKNEQKNMKLGEYLKQLKEKKYTYRLARADQAVSKFVDGFEKFVQSRKYKDKEYMI